MALATSKPVRPAMAILNHFGLTHYFNRIITEEDNEKVVNKPELVRWRPARALYARRDGGRPFYDVEGALANRIDAIGAGYSYGSEEELMNAGATHVAPDTEALRALLCPGASVPRGFFLTVEGLDGSGKTTQVDGWSKACAPMGSACFARAEPGGCEISEEIRHHHPSPRIIWRCARLARRCCMRPRAPSTCIQVIRPAVERGLVVLCDRFVDSSIAYQGGGRGWARMWFASSTPPPWLA